MDTGALDVVIVGAGLSGISAAYHVQTRLPGKSYAILEAREDLGGTWDIFRYPGIRSDSDMYTLGYSFRPWTEPKAIADGPSILRYVRETAEAYGIDRRIRYRRRVERARWSSERGRWEIEARDAATGELARMTARFLFVCAGYYDYGAGYAPDFPGREDYRGRVVHPQSWTPDVDYDGKRVIVIGSGATAVTLVPELAKRAAHVTMLQRSPTYIVSMPAEDPIAGWMRRRLSSTAAYSVTRWKNVIFGMGFYGFCRRAPGVAKRLLVHQMKRRAGRTVDAATHLTPAYDPWDQRLCLVPDGDLFDALRRGSAEIVTDHVASFTERGIRLRSGRELDADLVVTATGLQLKFLGGMQLEVDGARVEAPRHMVYKGAMLSDVPNFAFAIGYTNASWTLKCDLTSEYVCRLLRHMDDNGYVSAAPQRNDPSLEEEPLIDFSSGYVRRALGAMPKQGSRAPWKLHQNYALDLALFRHGRLADGAMTFQRRRPADATRAARRRSD
ncbi:MAG: NAD(P)/FAD-dependent oxidoreductase [Labilithrix sp.]|nr:NAD(P)/FAD-dependent oxidoreductase [Labilithrix sp.]